MKKKAISKEKPRTQEFDYGEFEREAIEGFQSGKGLVETEGVLTSRGKKIGRNWSVF